jgi:hypothetical protein
MTCCRYAVLAFVVAGWHVEVPQGTLPSASIWADLCAPLSILFSGSGRGMNKLRKSRVIRCKPRGVVGQGLDLTCIESHKVACCEYGIRYSIYLTDFASYVTGAWLTGF